MPPQTAKKSLFWAHLMSEPGSTIHLQWTKSRQACWHHFHTDI